MKNWFSSSVCALLFWGWGQSVFAQGIEYGQSCLQKSDLQCAKEVRDSLLDRDDDEFLAFHRDVLYHEGRYAELGRVLDKLGYPEEDPEDSQTPYRKTVAASQGMLLYERDGISIRHANGVEEILAEEAFETLDRSRTEYKKVFGAVPEHTLVMDIFPTAARFIDASSLPPEAVRTTGVIALSKWSRLLLTSPRASAGGYGWKDTAAHEYIHLVVAYLTDDHAPVWLQEGLAKFFEGLWRGGTENYLSALQQSLLAKAIQDDSFVPFEKFRYSMAYLDSSEEAALAYAQVSSMVHYLHTKRGGEVFPTLLSRVQQEEDPMFVMADLAGYSSFEEFRGGWKSFLQTIPLIQEQLKAAPPALDGAGGDFASDPVLSEREDLKKYMRLGELLLGISRPKAALVEFAKVLKEEGPPSPTLLYRKAQCQLMLKEEAKAIRLANEGARLYPEYIEIQMLLGEIQEKRGYLRKAIAHWQVAHDINPFDSRIQRALVSLYEKTSDQDGLIRHKKFLNILQTGGASTFTR
jgi:tetratricopeptide (TPR) repeat protein